MESKASLDVIETPDAATWATLNNYSSFRQSTIDLAAKDEATPQTQQRCACKANIIIHPVGPFRYALDALITIILIYKTVEIPIIIAFNVHMSFSEAAGVAALCCDILLFVDIIINFRVAYFDRFDRLRLITNTAQIATKYMRTWFIIDCISCLPVEFFIGHTFTNWLSFAKLLRLAKMMHILDRLSKTFMSREAKAFFKLFKLISFMLLFAHFAACMWWYVGSITDEPTWIDSAGLRSEDISTFEKYTYSWYWAVVTLFTTGYGDITATNTMEMWICSVCILIGTMFFSYFIGTLTMLITEGDKVKSYKLSKMEEAQHFCDIKKFPKELTRAILTHTAYHCNYNFVFDEEEFIRTLPPYLQFDVLTRISNNKIILKNINAFKSLKDEILGKISLKIKAVSGNKSKILFHKGSKAKNIYIQRTGTAVLDFHGSNKPKIMLERGSVFGISALISPKRRATVTCKTWSEFYCLPVVEIVNILQSEYPETWRKRWNKITKAVRIKGDIDYLDLGGSNSSSKLPYAITDFLHSGHNSFCVDDDDKTPKSKTKTVSKNNRLRNPFVLKSKSSNLRNRALKDEYKSTKPTGDTMVRMLDPALNDVEIIYANAEDQSDNVGDIAPGLHLTDAKSGGTTFRQKSKIRHRSRAKRALGKMGGIRKSVGGGRERKFTKTLTLNVNTGMSVNTTDDGNNDSLSVATPESATTHAAEVEMEQIVDDIANKDMGEILDTLKGIQLDPNTQSLTSRNREFSMMEESNITPSVSVTDNARLTSKLYIV